LPPYCSAPQAYIPHSRRIRESLSHPTSPKLSPCNLSARLNNPSNLVTKSGNALRTCGSVAAGERKSAMATVPIAQARMSQGAQERRWGAVGIGTTGRWVAIGECTPMMIAQTAITTAEDITTRIGHGVE
jgi:hypothetical protein